MKEVAPKENKKIENFKTSLLNDISNLLEHVLNICASYKIDLIREEEIVRVEKFHRYDKSLINKTIKDPRLFTILNNDVFPKNLYQYSYEENVDTYENRFIKFLLIDIKEDIEESYKQNEREKLPFLKSGVSYGRYGTFSLFNKFARDSLSEDESETKFYSLSLLRRINNLLSNEFFKRVKNINFEDVYATNIFINDKDYAYCYSYYLKAKENNNNSKSELVRNIFSFLKDKHFENLIFDKEKYLSFKKDDFVYSFKNNEKLDLTILYKNENLVSFYEFDFKINLFVKKIIISFEGKEYIMNIKELSDIIEIIMSLSTIVRLDEDICPICKKEIESNSCFACGTEFKEILKNNLRFAWILNPFAINLEEEAYEI